MFSVIRARMRLRVGQVLQGRAQERLGWELTRTGADLGRAGILR